MRHRKVGRKLGRTASHKKALMRTLASELFEHKRIHTTLAKAKELRPFSERIITRAKRALMREQQGKLPEGSNIDVHSRREVYKNIRKKHVLELLFEEIAPTVMDRNGGYTRVVKTGRRRGDGGETALIELVDWNMDQDSSFKRKKFNKPNTGNTQVASTPKSDDSSASNDLAAAQSTENDDSAIAEEQSNEVSSETIVAQTTSEDSETTDVPSSDESEAEANANDSDYKEVISANDATSEDSEDTDTKID